jgi:hypothetical protein
MKPQQISNNDNDFLGNTTGIWCIFPHKRDWISKRKLLYGQLVRNNFKKYLYIATVLWIRFHFFRIRIQKFFVVAIFGFGF